MAERRAWIPCDVCGAESYGFNTSAGARAGRVFCEAHMPLWFIGQLRWRERLRLAWRAVTGAYGDGA